MAGKKILIVEDEVVQLTAPAVSKLPDSNF
jgi:hypothetical protein